MPKRNQARQQVSDETAELKNRLEETEETLHAIRQYLVDAFVVTRADGEQVVTLNDADFPYRMMVESMNEGAVTLIPDGTIFYCNPRMAEMAQVESQKLIGVRFQDLIAPEQQSDFEALFKQAGQEGARGEFRLKTVQGNYVPVRLSVYQLAAEDIRGTSVIATDITERRQAEDALRKSESLFRLIAINSPDVIFFQDLNFRYSWIINPTPPYSSDQILGKTDSDFLPPQEAQQLKDLKEEVLKTGITVRQDVSLTVNEKRHWYDIVYQPYHDETGKVIGLTGYARDITERVHAEEKIRSLASKLTVAEQEERQRISQILHDDLQQRLFAIKAHLSLLSDPDRKKSLPSSVQVDLDQLQAWLSDAIGITRSLSIDLSPVVLQGEGLAEAILWLSSQMKEQYGLEVNLEVKENFYHFDSHMRVLLFRAVRELLFNVVKHAGTMEAEVTLEQVDTCSRITVNDAGKGFDASSVLNDPSISHGLLIIQDRLGLMGCKIEITSTPGAGTHAVIEVPMTKTSI